MKKHGGKDAIWELLVIALWAIGATTLYVGAALVALWCDKRDAIEKTNAWLKPKKPAARSTTSSPIAGW